MARMAGKNAVRFDDLLLDAIVALRSMVARATGWDGAPPGEKGRAAELGRGLAGERRYAKQTGNEALDGRLVRLKESAEAQLRMVQGRTAPGDEERAARVTADVAAYKRAARPPAKQAAKPAKKAATKPKKPAKKAATKPKRR